jgi:serine/threonine protein kinase
VEREEAEERQLVARLFQDIQFYRDLGKGAHALVKSGVDWKTKRKIAIKIYEKSQLKQDQLRSIKREVEILGSLDHPNIIKLYEIFESHRTVSSLLSRSA